VVRLGDDADRPRRRIARGRRRSGCAGCCSVSIDLAGESEAEQKGFNHPTIRRPCREAPPHGIAVQGCFTFGMDEDEPDVFERTAQFAIEAKIDLPRFAVVTPFPGTPLHKRLNDEGRSSRATGRSTTGSTSSSSRSA
jgi:hypothetical protein